jgi:phosphoribosylformimino-5-aminoimidazole carboxamide ribotide isomerase
VRVIPAIDLRDGACVQLVGGDYAEERVRIADPLAAARRFARAGFTRLHVVDLDAATGRGDNLDVIERLLAARLPPIQLGGGIRDQAAIERAFAMGAERVVVGTRGVEDPAWLERAAARFPGRVVLAADTRGGRVTTRGWSREVATTPETLAAAVAALPLAALLVTGVDREGRMEGPDTALIRRVAAAARVPVIASGGIRSRADLDALALAGAAEAVVGMALYTGALNAGPRPVQESRP